MSFINLSLSIFAFLTTIEIIFQLCLFMGLPWGAASMGGKFPGWYPLKMRLMALINSLLLFLILIIVTSKAQFLFLGILSFSNIAIWFVVFFFGIGTIINITTPSKIERIWAPVAALQMITSLIIAII